LLPERVLHKDRTDNEAIMSRFLIAICAGVAFAFWGVVPATGQSPTGNGVTSPWTEVHTARVRLHAGPRGNGSNSYLAGIEIALDAGWKTYWRNPGDAGVPPAFDWAGSTNLASAKVLYPAPSRLKEPAAETIGYTKAVLFPVEVTPQDVKKSVELNLLLEFGICREICIPAQAKLSLAIPPKALAGEPSAAMVAARAHVPRPQTERRREDPELVRMTASLDGPAPRLEVWASFPKGGKGADLFIEAPEGLYVPLPKRLPDAADGTARFEIDLARSDIAKDLKGKTLTLTLVSEEGAAEVMRVAE
jgi:DsbC/DsbD-like thiol-disulfide interchange protein